MQRAGGEPRRAEGGEATGPCADLRGWHPRRGGGPACGGGRTVARDSQRPVLAVPFGRGEVRRGGRPRSGRRPRRGSWRRPHSGRPVGGAEGAAGWACGWAAWSEYPLLHQPVFPNRVCVPRMRDDRLSTPYRGLVTGQLEERDTGWTGWYSSHGVRYRSSDLQDGRVDIQAAARLFFYRRDGSVFAGRAGIRGVDGLVFVDNGTLGGVFHSDAVVGRGKTTRAAGGQGEAASGLHWGRERTRQARRRAAARCATSGPVARRTRRPRGVETSSVGHARRMVWSAWRMACPKSFLPRGVRAPSASVW